MTTARSLAGARGVAAPPRAGTRPRVASTGAIGREVDEDLVLVDVHKCIACAMCAMVCPFDAVTFFEQANGMPQRIVATKCDGYDNGVNFSWYKLSTGRWEVITYVS